MVIAPDVIGFGEVRKAFVEGYRCAEPASPTRTDKIWEVPAASSVCSLVAQASSLTTAEADIFAKALVRPESMLPLVGLAVAVRCPNRIVQEQLYGGVVTSFCTINEGRGGTTYYQLKARCNPGELRHGGVGPDEITAATIITNFWGSLDGDIQGVKIGVDRHRRPSLEVTVLPNTASSQEMGNVDERTALALLAAGLKSVEMTLPGITPASGCEARALITGYLESLPPGPPLNMADEQVARAAHGALTDPDAIPRILGHTGE